MLFHLLYPLHTLFSPLNVFRYITFRSAYAVVTALLVCFFFGPPLIRRLREFKIRQIIRHDGPQTHLTKSGTPTMGGILIVAGIVVPTLLWASLRNRYVLLAVAVTLVLGSLGFLDDYLHVVRKAPKGLLGRYKLLVQIGVGLVVGIILYQYPIEPRFATATTIPFVKNQVLDLGLLYIPFVALVITATSNAVNLTDGLDGLASGLTALAAASFAGLAYLSGHIRLAEYLNIPYILGAGELTIFCAAMFGASLGFLWYNTHPADVFMGDTGSLALGGALGTVAVILKKELLLFMVGGIFVAEALSVIIQVVSYKLRGRRVFRMAPLHHHFELRGWPESRVVVRFWIVGMLLALLSLSTLKLQ
jgi:phospho-N-acetylmuramoyl-pentapeptide-transferase